MKIHTVTKIRNEIDIIEPFIRHLDALFDKVYLLDHKSKDGTTEVLKQVIAQRPDWDYTYLDFNGHFHKEVSNFFVRKSFTEGADYLFFLDADEFLYVKDRKDLERRLSELDNFHGVGKFHFRAVLPANDSATSFTTDTGFWLPPNRSATQKIVIPKKFYEQAEQSLSVTQGNHQVLSAEGYPVKEIDLGDLIHVSVRSLDQLQKKYIIKSIAYLAIEHRNPAEGIHNFNRLEAIAQKGDFSTLLNVEDGPPLPRSEKEFLSRGYRQVSLRSLEIPSSSQIEIHPLPSESNLATLVADALLNFNYESLQNADLLLSNGVMKIRAFPGQPATFQKEHPAINLNKFNNLIPSRWREKINKKRIRSAVLKSGLFDKQWYRDAYMKTHDSKLEPLDHFLQNGTKNRFNPGPSFDVGRYLDEYPDVRESGLNPLVHYLLHGKVEQRTVFPVFNPDILNIPEKNEGGNCISNSSSQVSEIDKNDRIKDVDVLVYLHDDLSNITRCLDSLVPTLSSGDRLWLITGPTDQTTMQYLKSIQESHSDIIHMLNITQHFSTARAINIGLSKSTADDIIFVDSDAVVEQNWISKLMHLASFDPAIGIVSPLFSPLYNFSISGKQDYPCEIPGLSKASFDIIENGKINQYCETWSVKNGHAIVPFIDGFCFLIKKEVVRKIGDFDDLTFQLGIGETTDYCFRAVDAGYKYAIATDTFIHRQNSFITSRKMQQQKVKDSYAYMKHKHSHERVNSAQIDVRSNPVLNELHKEMMREFGIRIFIE